MYLDVAVELTLQLGRGRGYIVCGFKKSVVNVETELNSAEWPIESIDGSQLTDFAAHQGTTVTQERLIRNWELHTRTRNIE